MRIPLPEIAKKVTYGMRYIKRPERPYFLLVQTEKNTA